MMFHVDSKYGNYARCAVDPNNCTVSKPEHHFEKVNEALPVSEKIIAENFKELREMGRNKIWEKPTDNGGDSY